MTTRVTSSLENVLAEAFRQGGEYTSVYLDVSPDVGAPIEQVQAGRQKSVADQLSRAGAPAADLLSVSDALSEEPAGVGEVARFLLVHDGEVIVDRCYPGLLLAPEAITYGPLPDVVPLLAHETTTVSYLLVETDRDGGRVQLFHSRVEAAEDEEAVQGRTDTLHKVPGGGWRHDHFQNHAEDIWRATQVELATAIDDMVRRYRPRLLVVAGDIRARQLLADNLASESLSILSVEPTDAGQAGASTDPLIAHIDRELARIAESEVADALDRLAIHEGRGDNTVEDARGAVVQALAAAQVDTLVLDPLGLGDATLLALDSEPWVASAPEETLSASVLAEAPAAAAMVRAALLTDARILFTDAERLPGGTPVAALLRWRTGPEVPGA